MHPLAGQEADRASDSDDDTMQVINDLHGMSEDGSNGADVKYREYKYVLV
jgi:hypothetical protein